jgi:hypothetical protein
LPGADRLGSAGVDMDGSFVVRFVAHDPLLRSVAPISRGS